MRSIPLKAAGIFILVAAWACGGDGGGVGPNVAANFSQICTGLACTFNDASTPTDQVTAWSWNFNDPNSGAANTSNIQNPAHTFSAAGTYNVQLTVTGSGNATNSKTNPVTVTAPANTPPTASFSVPSCGVGVDCTFHSTSTDVEDGAIAATATHWDFGDPTSPNNTADGLDATHRYTRAGSFNVTLNVTDAAGAPGTTTQSVTVLPAAAQDCATTGTAGNYLVTCNLAITQPSTVKLTLTSRSCELIGNRVSIAQPRQTAFGNICTRPFPADYTVTNAAGTAAAVYEAGTQLQILFTQGTPGPSDPAPGTPVARVEGTAPDWTVTIDDGGNPNGQNEPDFNDVLIAVHAAAP